MIEKIIPKHVDVCDFANITGEDIDRMGMSYFDATRLWEDAIFRYELNKELKKKSRLAPRWCVFVKILIRRLMPRKNPPTSGDE